MNNNSLNLCRPEIIQRRHAADHLIMLHNHYIIWLNPGVESNSLFRLAGTMTCPQNYIGKVPLCFIPPTTLKSLKIVYNVDGIAICNSTIWYTKIIITRWRIFGQ